MDNLLNKIRGTLLNTHYRVHQLIAINVFVFFVIKLIYTFEFLITNSSVYYNIIIANLVTTHNLDIVIFKPWTLFTYMFVHTDFFHMLFNMIGLYWFGKLVEHFVGREHLFRVYIYGGLIGAIFYISACNLIPYFATKAISLNLIGSSASITAVLVLIAASVPNLKVMMLFFGEVSLKYIAFFYVLFDLINTITLNSGVSFAQIGSGILGFIYAKKLSHIDFSLFSSISHKMSDIFKSKNLPEKKDDVSQTEIDAILDKILKGGYSNLSSKEKEKLFKASQKKTTINK